MLSHKELSSCFIPGLYEPQHAIKLFLHTFTLAPLNSDQQQPKTTKRKAPQLYVGTPDDKEYLMMCLLPAIPDLKLQQYIPSSSNLEPLVVKFTDDCVPLGCFGCSISCLLSVFKWKVNRKGDGTPECLAHNIVSLSDPSLPVKIIVVDATQRITVHIDAKEDDCELYPYICCQIHETLFSALMKVFDIMKLTEIEVSPAVLCPCKEPSEAHSACHFKVKTTHFLRCSKTNAAVGKAQDKHMMWLGVTEESQLRNEIPFLQSSKQSSLQAHDDRVDPSHYHPLQTSHGLTSSEGAKLQAQENRDAAQKKIIKETSVFPESTPSSSGVATSVQDREDSLQYVSGEHATSHSRKRKHHSESEDCSISRPESCKTARLQLSVDKELNIDDLTAVLSYLLNLNGDELNTLGQILGLNNTTLTNYQHNSLMKYRDSIVKAWLLKKDDVIESGGPYWSTLEKALRDPLLSHNGIANKIRKDRLCTQA